MTSPFPTPPGLPGQPPRSTPIPGAPPPIPAGAFGAPGAGDPGAGGPGVGGPTPPPMPPGFGGPGDPFGAGGLPSPRRSRSGVGKLWWIVGLLVVASVSFGVFMTVKGVSKAKDAVNDAVEQAQKNSEKALENAKPGLSDEELAALSDAEASDAATSDSDPGTKTTEAVGPVYLWDVGTAGALAKSFDDAIPGSPTKFLQILIYGEYASATAQDPVKKNHVDSYDWRSGKVSEPSPQQNQDGLEGHTFSINEVPWDKLAALMAQAEVELNVEDATIRYFIIDKNTFDDDAGLTIRAYVSGPRSSGYVVADGTAAITKVYD